MKKKLTLCQRTVSEKIDSLSKGYYFPIGNLKENNPIISLESLFFSRNSWI